MPFGGAYAESRIKLSRRLVNTLLLLLVFRLLAAIPILNVDEERLHHLLAANPLIGAVDLFAGGETLEKFSIAAAGIFPYLIATILVQVAIAMSSRLREMRHGEKGKKRMELLTRVVTIPVAFLFAWALTRYLSQQVGLFPGEIHWFTGSSFWPSFLIVGLVTLGSLASTAVSDLITRKGVGKGTEVVLLGGSSLVFLKQISQAATSAPDLSAALVRTGWILAGGIVVVVVTIYVMDSRRNVPILYPKRVAASGRVKETPATQLPLLLNSGRVLPVSAAIGLLALLQLGQSFFHSYAQTRAGAAALWLTRWIVPTNGWYWVALSSLIVIFTYVYNYSVLWQDDRFLVEELKKESGYIPGIRPGANTEAYLTRVIRSISLPGGVSLALLAAGIPYLVLRVTHQNIMVTMLSLIVVVITAQSLRDEVKVYHISESYRGMLERSHKKGLDRL